jgi:hypothetical protein
MNMKSHSSRAHGRLARAALLCPAIVLVFVVIQTASAFAAAPRAAGWTIDSTATPTHFSSATNENCLAHLETPVANCDAYVATVTNAGSKASNGSTITLADTVPAGVTIQKVSLFWTGTEVDLGPFFCSTEESTVKCGFESGLELNETLKLIIYVTVDEPEQTGLRVNKATVSGGGAPTQSTSNEHQISDATPAFGPDAFNFYIDGLDGARDSEAGDHPYEVTTTIDMNSVLSRAKAEVPVVTSVHDVRDVIVDLPLGFVGSTLAAPECTLAQLSSTQRCPQNTIVGHIRTEPTNTNQTVNSPIWNLAPEEGVPAEFGFVDLDKNTHVFFAHVVPSPAGYVLEVRSTDIPQVALSHIVATFFGNPAERDGTGNAQVPFFTNPTGCASGPLKATVHVDSWQQPGRFNADGTPDLSDPNWASAESVSPPVTGCNELRFSPELHAQPTTHVADSPSGLEFEMSIPQTEIFGVRSTPALKTATVTLPVGMTVDPSAGDGLQACSEAQVGWLGGTPRNFNLAEPECPEASKIGSLELTTPLIPGVLNGEMYLAAQDENPFGSALAAYIVVNDPRTGVLLKIAGMLKTDSSNGQITGAFPESPQLPFNNLKLHFFGGPRAELATPENCGAFTTSSVLQAWSTPDSGPAATPFDSFSIDSGCVSGFSPSFTAGVTNLQAGAYSPFVTSFARADTDQEFAGLTLSLPPGVLAKITGVPQCSDASANTGQCPEASRVGTVTASAGPGPNPLTVTGKAYLTGPYKGGPYGLAVVVPAVAGPFNFGNVVVRQSLHIDRLDAHVTDVSDPFPTILNPRSANGELNGIPIRLRRVDVHIDRPEFTLNPTSCARSSMGGAVSSVGGASAPVSAPFQVTNCASLKFAPKFAVSTSGKTSKANGASLSVKLTYPKAQLGTYANVAKVKVSLPKQLPSRLTTLQKACLAAVFAANPANCPPESVIGHAKVITPLLPDPLTGPAYFVSHGGEAFPDLTIVLQGDNVLVDLVGSTQIKNGITTSTFKATPDVPFDSFELSLPQGKFSALTSNSNLCKSSLVMPTEFVAQNGVVLNQATKISVSGCPKALTRAQRLAKALKACRKKKGHAKRAACEARARKQFGAEKRAKAKRKSSARK